MRLLSILFIILFAFRTVWGQHSSFKTSLFKYEKPLSYKLNFTAPLNFTTNNFAFPLEDEKVLLRKGNIKMAFGIFGLLTTVTWAGLATAWGVGWRLPPPYGLFVVGTTTGLLAISIPLTVFGSRQRKQAKTMLMESKPTKPGTKTL